LTSDVNCRLDPVNCEEKAKGGKCQRQQDDSTSEIRRRCRAEDLNKGDQEGTKTWNRVV